MLCETPWYDVTSFGYLFSGLNGNQFVLFQADKLLFFALYFTTFIIIWFYRVMTFSKTTYTARTTLVQQCRRYMVPWSHQQWPSIPDLSHSLWRLLKISSRLRSMFTTILVSFLRAFTSKGNFLRYDISYLTDLCNCWWFVSLHAIVHIFKVCSYH